MALLHGAAYLKVKTLILTAVKKKLTVSSHTIVIYCQQILYVSTEIFFSIIIHSIFFLVYIIEKKKSK